MDIEFDKLFLVEQTHPVIIKLLPFNKGLKYIVFLYRTLKIFLQGYCKTENMVYCKG
jgi:hypothetical protein